MLERSQNARKAADFVRGELARIKGPVSLVSRLNKRIDMLSMAGAPAPELAVEDFVGDPPPPLASLRGHPVVLFLFAEGCGDCKAQATALGRTRAKYFGQGLQVVAVTRYYEEEAERVHEKARIDSVWKAVYKDVGTVPIVISTASMERYGVSSTPTFAFIDREGVVREYTPTRLTDAEFDRAIARITR